MKKTRILFASAEAVPFIKTGGLADVVGSLPYALDPAKTEVRVIMPAYTAISPSYRNRMRDVMSFTFRFNGRDRYLGLKELTYNGIVFWFVDNEDYFGGAGPYTDYDYDIEKFVFFSRAVFELLPRLDFRPDIFHCHDWHTGLIPVYLKTLFSDHPFFRGARSLFTIHNLKFQGICDRNRLLAMSGLPAHLFAAGRLCSPGSGNIMQGALYFSDKITTVSKSYAEEVKTPAFGEGLDWLLRERADDFSGIVNGIDTAVFDPASDPALKTHYDVHGIARGKAAAKAALQKETGLAREKDSLLFGMVTRLTDQKGLDLVIPLLEELTRPPRQLIVLGTGDYIYEQTLRQFAESKPGRMQTCIFYNEAFSHRIYAGCDAFLMPSRFEPCGLSQLIALRYGTLPIVRATGGLKDTVISYDKAGTDATGFLFEDYDLGGLRYGADLAGRTFFKERSRWNKLRQNAMKKDFSWESSAREYEKLYSLLTMG